MNSFETVQNEALGAHAIWEYSRFYNEYSETHEYSPVILALPVLPIVFNARARGEICNRNFREGSLLRTISDTRDLYSGLQDRMEGLVGLTLKSLYLASAVDLVQYDERDSLIIPKRKTPLNIELSYGKEYDQIIQASRRIGAWFGQLDISEIMIHFNVVF
ncbi:MULTISPECIES: three component ABC system middle component [unclassified Imperialibacter]|uniref:three component ABC system middle component n=1 Tax=unclassified Imperialibacter TaxID=2629706 RepID=UPI00125A88A2|nr:MULTISPECIES: three component ABC system middle component [unclassified Imperialibacter]CAD5277557.1 conserved hypothetical protein [Imperialibacter sp. 75]CAD5295454.1 conserved hypothetical protein [Imperialibacter sp. 89]VVT12045.1 conserved hypothetical protein [Imperialibacter sp. EC-SDR9]